MHPLMGSGEPPQDSAVLCHFLYDRHTMGQPKR